MIIKIETFKFNAIPISDFHDIISLRMEVFGIEQQALYNDLDGYDKDSFHLIVRDKNEIIGTARILPPGLKYSEVSFGRLVVKKEHRNKGIAKKIMKEILFFCHEYYPNINIKISAMKYLEQFYTNYGFKQISKTYLDCGIEHIDMIKEFNS